LNRGIIGVIGAGAFGTALAVAFARGGHPVRLWLRDANRATAMQNDRISSGPLPGVALPESVTVTAVLADVSGADAVLLCLPMQQLRGFLSAHATVLDGRILVACCKGVDLTTLQGPTAAIAAACPRATPAILTGPSFAADIARGLPTALTLACADDTAGLALQELLTAPNLRLYRNTDVTGAELGGAVKNVIAIACGAAIGQGMGDSARAALMTRGFAEMQRLALRLGARAETLTGLSGLGDMVLTCTSDQSRNYRHGLALGRGLAFDPGVTVEGVATAQAVARLAATLGVDMPITAMLAAIIEGRLAVTDALSGLFARPLKPE
jgi:glycerol-3-phosphate dehydrogenase (NAD(P)+)